VIHLLRHWPHLSGAVQACRSTHADVPGTGVIPLAKFASMGSALTFPIESMVFLAITIQACSGFRESQDGHLLREAVTRLSDDVRVFGDDIIAPQHMARTVASHLESYGLKVNRDKSFWNGKFRESCGGDFYAGTDVSVVRVRQPLTFSSATADVNCLEGTVALRNNLYEAGLWKTAYWLDSRLEAGLKHRYPYVTATSSGLGRRSFLGYSSERTCRFLHAPLVHAWVPQPRIPISRCSGEGALLKHLLKGGGVLQRGHLERSGRPKSVALRLRWVRPF
jgi:hypothetical protein